MTTWLLPSQNRRQDRPLTEPESSSSANEIGERNASNEVRKVSVNAPQREAEGIYRMPGLQTRERFYRIFTARAARIAIVPSDIVACSIIRTLAQRDSTGTSVGENAVLVLKARNR